MKKYRSSVVLALSIILLSGCGTEKEYIEMSTLEAADTTVVNSVSNVTALSKSDRENLIYQQISDRTLIDTTALDSISTEDSAVINNYVNDICEKLKGAENDSLSDSFTNYLLFEMEKTPYIWDKSTVEILGINSSSRSFVVDVTFRTTGKLKEVKNDSAIALGDPDYNKKCENRLNRYIDILDKKKGDINGDSGWEEDLAEFESHYGKVEDIIEGQVNDSLYEKAKQGKFITYSCMTDSEEEQLNATMKVRFILNYEYSLGVKLGMRCDHLYIINYTLESDPLEGCKTLTLEGSSAISDAVDTLIYSENRAIDEDNYIGLYSMIENFEKYDKYYYDMFNTTFRKIKGYVISLYDIDGTTIKAGVTRVRKVRSVNSNMSYPTYEEKWLYRFRLVGSELKIIDETMISSTLIGEPSIVSRNGKNDTEGFVSSVNISDTEKKKIEESVEKFSKLQVERDMESKEFIKYVDLSISARDLSRLKSDMFSIEDVVSKATWIKKYNTAYTNYVSLTILEVFYKSDGTALECESEMSLIYKDNSYWQIFDYRRLSSVDINPDSVSTTSALCVQDLEVEKVNTKDDNTDNSEVSNLEGEGSTEDDEQVTD